MIGSVPALRPHVSKAITYELCLQAAGGSREWWATAASDRSQGQVLLGGRLDVYVFGCCTSLNCTAVTVGAFYVGSTIRHAFTLLEGAQNTSSQNEQETFNRCIPKGC